MRSATNSIEGVGGGDYQRIYIPRHLTLDSVYPFVAGENIRLQIVTTACDREVIAITPEALEISDDSEIVLERSTKEIQTSLEELE